MKKWRYLWLSPLVFIVVIAGAISWCAYTASGTRWILEAVLHVMPVKIEIKKISGILAGDLSLEGVGADTESLKIRIDKISLSCRPLYAVTGGMTLRKVALHGIYLDDKQPDIKKPVDLSWPRPPRFLSWLNTGIKSFEVKGLTYRSGNSEWKIIDKLDTGINWFFGTLAADNLTLQSSVGKTEGNIKTNFTGPAFSACLKTVPARKIADVDSFVLVLKLKESRKPEQMSGIFQISTSSGARENIKAVGKLSVMQNSLAISELLISQEGRKGTLFSKGEIDLSTGVPLMNLHMDISDCNLSREVKFDTFLSGTIELKTDFMNYQGAYNLINNVSSWKKAQIKGVFDMDLHGIKLLTIEGMFLKGTVKGEIQTKWGKKTVLSGNLKIRTLDPAGVTPSWQGRVNGDLAGRFEWPEKMPLEGIVEARILDSVLRRKALSGTIDARWHQGAFTLEKFELRGNGFDLAAQGALDKKINYQVRVSDLSGLIPDTGGHFTAEGWTRWSKGRLAGTLKAGGGGISAFGARVDTVQIETELDGNGTDALQGKIRVRGIEYGFMKCRSLDTILQGRISAHDILIRIVDPEGNGQVYFSGGYTKGLWQGIIKQITWNNKRFGSFDLTGPASIRISSDRLTVTGLSLTGSANESFDLDMDVAPRPIPGYIKAKWQALNIARANSMLSGPEIAGRTSGSLDMEWSGKKKAKAAVSLKLYDAAIKKPVNIRISKGSATLNWTETGLLSSYDIHAGETGRLEGQFRSNQPAFPGVPETGQFEAVLSALDVDIVKPWLHPALDLKGTVSGTFRGLLLHGRRLEISGRMRLSQGSLAWSSDEGLITAKAEKADMDLVWSENLLKGSLSLILLNQGYLKSDFQLPVVARLPVKIEGEGAVRITAKGEMQEKGLLTAIFPGLIGESKGQLAFAFTAGGTWNMPDLQGSARLSDASAYLYPAGIKIQNIKADALLDRGNINISSFSLNSGEGLMEGSATASVKDWRIVSYKGKLRGSRCRTVYLPELQILTSPDLSFSGDMDNLVLRGSVEVPEAMVQRFVKEGVVTASPDVVIKDAPKKQVKSRGPQTGIDMQVNVILGNKVMINVEGVNARLEGKVLLAAKSFDKIGANGQIEVAKGQYNRHGISLDIKRGRIVFTGGPVDFATLDILAVRKIRDMRRLNDVQVGVTITGTPRRPLVKLYSEPAMSDEDILSYVVLGKPMDSGADSNQAGLLLQAAGTMLAKDQSASLQGKLMNLFGVDTFDVRSDTGKGSSSQVSSIQPRGIPGQTGGAAGSGSVSGSIVTIGKYLSPELYIAFGRSLFTGDYIASARYSFLKNWELEGSRKGTDSGVDLYYKIEFN